jgi:adenosylhomocysteinase
MEEAARIGEIFITATGMKDVLVRRHFEVMRDGAVVCNTGHYDCEIRIADLEALARAKREIRKDNEEYTLKDGRRIYLLAKGRLVNLAAAEGHPSEVMDMSFANQFLAMRYLVEKRGSLKNTVYDVPKEQDERIATLKLGTMGIRLDALSDEQVRYRTDYASGT